MECNMKDRVVMVSGGSNGIGRSAVEEFAKRGCKVVIFDYDETTVDEIREDCKGYGGSVDFRKVNMLEKLFPISRINMENWTTLSITLAEVT